jgi:hypothetical protein
VTEDHAVRVFKACEFSKASSSVRASFIHAGFIYVRGTDGGHTIALDEAKVREAAELRDVWDLDYTLGKLSRRWQAWWGFSNEDVFIE